jgi:hypothetical protein
MALPKALDWSKYLVSSSKICGSPLMRGGCSTQAAVPRAAPVSPRTHLPLHVAQLVSDGKALLL